MIVGSEWRMDELFIEIFDERERAVLSGCSEGSPLDEIGASLCLSRERVRQLRNKARDRLAKRADGVQPGWRERVWTIGSKPAAHRDDFLSVFGPDTDPLALEGLLSAAGLQPPRTWAGPLLGWWSTEPRALYEMLSRLIDAAPFRGDELEHTATEAGLPTGLPLERVLGHPASRLDLSPDGHWVRRKARGRDAAYLWLLEAGRPCRPDELLSTMGVLTIAAVREALRRDDRFRQIRPEGTWALTEWTHLRASPYSTALEAMIATVTESGPLPRARLFSQVTDLYPVSSWRLKQCLSSDQLGETPDGLIDLVSRGALPIEENEPSRPESMVLEGGVLGIRLSVTKDLLRGSGVNTHTWLTWRLGLRRAPASRAFAFKGDYSPLMVRRGTGNAQLSTLRPHALELGVVEGCVLVVLLHLSDHTARVGHGCVPETCPARNLEIYQGGPSVN